MKPASIPHFMTVSPQPPQSRGFTLLEVLIAFVVVTLSGAIMMQQLFVITKYAERAFAQQDKINESLNQANLFSTTDWNFVDSRLSEKELKLSKRDEESVAHSLTVRNYPYEDVDVPMTVAFSPFQVFDFGGMGSLNLSLLQPGLLPTSNTGRPVIGR